MEVSGVVRRLDGHGPSPTRTATPTVALTFDACGAPTAPAAGFGVDEALLGLLRRHQVPATLFLNGRWIAAHPGLTDELVHDPLFEIGNHGTSHRPLSVTGRTAYQERGTGSVAEVYDEIVGNALRLTTLLGRPPAWFRSGTAHYDEVAVRVVGDLGARVAGFSVNGDAGTTFTAAQVAAAVGGCRDGDIVISHMNRPEHATAKGYAAALPTLPPGDLSRPVAARGRVTPCRRMRCADRCAPRPRAPGTSARPAPPASHRRARADRPSSSKRA
jgi:peptidoglycan/xylan/chitin deacetylase (PgdA/CDA1 family)